MCKHCHTALHSEPTRRAFLRDVGVGALALSVGFTGATSARAAVREAPVGTSANWARLITPNPFWSLHSEQDARIAAFLRDEAGLRLTAATHAVDPASAAHLAAFPFLATNGLERIGDSRTAENLREYLERGGFLFIEGCLDHRVTRNFGIFMANQVGWLKRLFPDLTLRRWAPTHAIFRTRFNVAQDDLALIDPPPDDLRWKDMPQALYGVYAGDTLLAVISLLHLQCEWFTKPEKIPHVLRQLANIYVYAMTR